MLELTGVTVANGTSNAGGAGIDNRGTLTVGNSTFSGNSAPNNGGGIRNSGTLTVTNSSFSGNSANEGGGIDNNDTLTAKNTIIANSPSGGNCADSVGDSDSASISDSGG